VPSSQPPAASRQVWSYLGRYRGHVIAGIALLVATSSFALAIPYLLGRIIDALQGPHPGQAIPPLAMGMIGLAVLQAVTRIGSRVTLFNAARKAEYDLRSELFRHLLSLDSGFFGKTPTGDVMSRLINDVQTVRAMWGPGILNVVNTSFVFTTAVVLMLSIDPWLTLWAILPYPSMVMFGRIFSRRLFLHSRAVQEQLGSLSAAVQEDLTGIGVIKNYTLEAERARQFDVMSASLRDRNMRLVQIRGQLMPTLTGLASLSVVIVLYVGGRAVIDPNEPLKLGQLIQFNGYLALLVWPTLALGWMLSLLQRGRASWQRLEDFLATEPTITDGDGAPLSPPEVRGELVVRDLSFKFGETTILDHVSFEVPAGTTTAIVGRTGSGKSTLVEMIPRLVDVPPGTVFVDGRDVTTLPLESLRALVGYAPQEAFLFSRTIAANIAYAASSDAVEGAARAAGLSRDLEALPAGMETVVGERGITLSGGQRQRVALARAIAAAPRILILDDSLSSVDANTEREILGHLRDVLRDRTALLISHRIAAVRSADQILVLDAGSIIERGTHDELLAAGGAYAELYRDQLTDDVLDVEEDA